MTRSDTPATPVAGVSPFGEKMIPIADHAEGLVIQVRAQPGAKRSAVVGQHGDALKVAVTAPPQDGRANDALVEVLRDALGLKRAQIELLSGQTSRDKRFLVRGINRADLLARIAALLE